MPTTPKINPNEDKHVSFLVALDKGMATLMFDMTHSGVVLSDAVRALSKDGKHMALNYSFKFQNAQIKTSDKGVAARLSFGPERYDTFIPWESVQGLALGEQLLGVWPSVEDAQETVLAKEDIDLQTMLNGLDMDGDWFAGPVADG